MKITMDDFINKKIAVRTGTGENLKKLLEMCEEHGLRWCGGKKASAFTTDDYGDECCVGFNYLNLARLGYAETVFYKKESWEIVDFSDIVSEQPGEEGEAVLRKEKDNG